MIGGHRNFQGPGNFQGPELLAAPGIFQEAWKFSGPGNFQAPWKIPGSWIFPGPLENSRGGGEILVCAQCPSCPLPFCPSGMPFYLNDISFNALHQNATLEMPFWNCPFLKMPFWKCPFLKMPFRKCPLL